MNKAEAKTSPAFIDGRDVPPYCVLFTEEVMSGEVQGLSRAGLILWLCINIRCNKRSVEDQRQWKVSWKTLLEDCALSRASVGRALKELEEADLIKRRRRGLGRVNRILLCKPPSLIPKIVRTPLTSQNQDPGSQSRIGPGGPLSGEGAETPEGSSSDTLYISGKTSSPTEVQGGPQGSNPKSQAFDEEQLVEWCYVLHSLVALKRMSELLEDELKQMFDNQQLDTFIETLSSYTNTPEDTIRKLIATPGFYQEFFGGE